MRRGFSRQSWGRLYGHKFPRRFCASVSLKLSEHVFEIAGECFSVSPKRAQAFCNKRVLCGTPGACPALCLRDGIVCVVRKSRAGARRSTRMRLCCLFTESFSALCRESRFDRRGNAFCPFAALNRDSRVPRIKSGASPCPRMRAVGVERRSRACLRAMRFGKASRRPSRIHQKQNARLLPAGRSRSLGQ
jgi:hypothetical protein